MLAAGKVGGAVSKFSAPKPQTSAAPRQSDLPNLKLLPSLRGAGSSVAGTRNKDHALRGPPAPATVSTASAARAGTARTGSKDAVRREREGADDDEFLVKEGEWYSSASRKAKSAGVRAVPILGKAAAPALAAANSQRVAAPSQRVAGGAITFDDVARQPPSEGGGRVDKNSSFIPSTSGMSSTFVQSFYDRKKQSASPPAGPSAPQHATRQAADHSKASAADQFRAQMPVAAPRPPAAQSATGLVVPPFSSSTSRAAASGGVKGNGNAAASAITSTIQQAPIAPTAGAVGVATSQPQMSQQLQQQLEPSALSRSRMWGSKRDSAPSAEQQPAAEGTAAARTNGAGKAAAPAGDTSADTSAQAAPGPSAVEKSEKESDCTDVFKDVAKLLANSFPKEEKDTPPKEGARSSARAGAGSWQRGRTLAEVNANGGNRKLGISTGGRTLAEVNGEKDVATVLQKIIASEEGKKSIAEVVATTEQTSASGVSRSGAPAAATGGVQVVHQRLRAIESHNPPPTSTKHTHQKPAVPGTKTSSSSSSTSAVLPVPPPACYTDAPYPFPSAPTPEEEMDDDLQSCDSWDLQMQDVAASLASVLEATAPELPAAAALLSQTAGETQEREQLDHKTTNTSSRLLFPPPPPPAQLAPPEGTGSAGETPGAPAAPTPAPPRPGSENDDVSTLQPNKTRATSTTTSATPLGATTAQPASGFAAVAPDEGSQQHFVAASSRTTSRGPSARVKALVQQASQARKSAGTTGAKKRTSADADVEVVASAKAQVQVSGTTTAQSTQPHGSSVTKAPATTVRVGKVAAPVVASFRGRLSSTNATESGAAPSGSAALGAIKAPPPPRAQDLVKKSNTNPSPPPPPVSAAALAEKPASAAVALAEKQRTGNAAPSKRSSNVGSPEDEVVLKPAKQRRILRLGRKGRVEEEAAVAPPPPPTTASQIGCATTTASSAEESKGKGKPKPIPGGGVGIGPPRPPCAKKARAPVVIATSNSSSSAHSLPLPLTKSGAQRRAKGGVVEPTAPPPPPPHASRPPEEGKKQEKAPASTAPQRKPKETDSTTRNFGFGRAYLLPLSVQKTLPDRAKWNPYCVFLESIGEKLVFAVEILARGSNGFSGGAALQISLTQEAPTRGGSCTNTTDETVSTKTVLKRYELVEIQRKSPEVESGEIVEFPALNLGAEEGEKLRWAWRARKVVSTREAAGNTAQLNLKRKPDGVAGGPPVSGTVGVTASGLQAGKKARVR